MINALVLAAGESQRMAMPKPLLRFEATTFLERIVTILQQSHVDRITVVLGSQAARIRALAGLSAVETVENREYRKGQLSSLAAGIRSMPIETDAIVLCLVDNPFITSEVVNGIIGAFRETGSPIVVPVVEGRRGHPTLFARPVFEDLLNAPTEKGARHVVHANKDRVFEFEVSERAILTSIDTPEDYRVRFGTAPQIKGHISQVTRSDCRR
ncbi:MAG: nucleotidyltransferase family protein [Pirellulaceae bacterium]